MKPSVYLVLVMSTLIYLCGSLRLSAIDQIVEVELPSGNAVDTLKQLAAQSELQLIYSSGSLAGAKTNAVKGTYPASQVLVQMLKGTSFAAVQDNETGAFAIIRQVTNESESQTNHLSTQTSKTTEQTHMNQTINQNKTLLQSFLKGVLAFAVASSSTASGQEAEVDEVYELTPFEVASDSIGYLATSSLAGTRLRTDLSDIGSAVSVFTAELMEDVGAVDNETLLAYGVNTEVGGANGNFINPNTDGVENQNLNSPNGNTRVRGLTSADNTRNYYLSDVPWDGYIINRVDIQRGANSILFGVGSPAGIINATTVEAGFYDSGEVRFQVDKFDSVRTSLSINREIIDNVLAIRVAYLNDDQKFRQRPAYDDDERLFGAVTWAPESLNQDGTIFKVKGNFEVGEITSNRPRYVAPIDGITPWFAAPGTSGFGGDYANFADWGLGGRLIDPINENEIQTVNNSSGRYYSPWVGTTFGGMNPKLIYDESSSSVRQITENSVNHRGSYFWSSDLADEGRTEAIINDGNLTDGEVQGHVRGTATMYIRGKNAAASAGNLPFQGFWKDSSFTDTTYFDFYNQLLDGNTKMEFKKFQTYEVDLTNTFLDNKVGYNVGWFYQKYESQFDANLGQVFAPSISVNIATLDRTASPQNRVANRYAGQALIRSDNPSGNFNDIERESKRLQVFFNHDFAENSDSAFSRILGRHDLVGILTERDKTQRTRGYQQLGFEREFTLGRGDTNENENTPGLGARMVEYASSNNSFAPDFLIYPSSDGSGLRGLSGIGDIVYPSGSVNMQGFDATPIAGFTAEDAIVEGFQDIYAGDDFFSTNSRNPDLYNGWGSIGNYNLVNAADDDQSLEYLTTNRARNTEKVESKAAVWTGKFWDGAVVGMYGWREDDSTETWPNHSYTDDGPNFDADDLVENGGPNGESYKRSITAQTKNWSAKVNLSYITGLSDNLPFDLHALYSEGEVQTPDPSRIDVFGRTLENATGKTEDTSLMIITKDGKWSFRATKYETTVLNAVSGSTVNSDKWQLQQVLQQGALRSGFIETDASGYTADNLNITPEAQAWANGKGIPEERIKAEYNKQVVAPAWREFEARLWNEVPLARSWYLTEFQPGDRVAPNILFPDNATLTENQVSSGYEFELTANPTDNWTIAINASQTEAVRDGVPSADFGEAVDIIIEGLKGTPAGEIPMWWNNGPNIVNTLDPFIGQLVLARALNGSVQPEIRKWRGNLITNYDFDEGALKGLGVGGAYRYEDGQIYSYQPIMNSDGSTGVDLSTSYKDPNRDTFDFWISYRTKLTDKVDWRIQLNLRNVFGENELVPLHRNPDGSFGTMGIREGSSWTLSNTFTF